MPERFEALAEVTLAIARVAAERDAAFAEALGSCLRGALQRQASRPPVFDATFQWLSRFEEGGAQERYAADADGSPPDASADDNPD